MFDTFITQIKVEAVRRGMTLAKLSIGMGYCWNTLTAAVNNKRLSLDLMVNIADHFEKDIIYHNGEFEMIERKERNGYC